MINSKGEERELELFAFGGKKSKKKIICAEEFGEKLSSSFLSDADFSGFRQEKNPTNFHP